MLPPALVDTIEEDHRALDAFVKGDPGPKKALYSRAPDATLANPYGPPARGWDAVHDALERAASVLRNGEALGFERVTEYEHEGCYIVEIERCRARLGGSEEVQPFSLRVTSIYRLEDDGWRILHRHADPITGPREADSVVQR